MAESIDATYTYGNLLRVSFDYKKIDGEEQPVMIFTGKTDNAFQIPLNCAYKYAEKSDIPLIETASRVSVLMGLGVNRGAVFRIADIIQNHLQELCRMPPTRTAYRQEQDYQTPSITANGIKIQ